MRDEEREGRTESWRERPRGKERRRAEAELEREALFDDQAETFDAVVIDADQAEATRLV